MGVSPFWGALLRSNALSLLQFRWYLRKPDSEGLAICRGTVVSNATVSSEYDRTLAGSHFRTYRSPLDRSVLDTCFLAACGNADPCSENMVRVVRAERVP